MNCPECNKVLDMRVQVGIKAPSDLEGKFTKGMFRNKNVWLEYTLWETATYSCSYCGHRVGRLGGNYTTKLEDENKQLQARVAELEKRITVENWYMKDKIDSDHI